MEQTIIISATSAGSDVGPLGVMLVGLVVINLATALLMLRRNRQMINDIESR